MLRAFTDSVLLKKFETSHVLGTQLLSHLTVQDKDQALEPSEAVGGIWQDLLGYSS